MHGNEMQMRLCIIKLGGGGGGVMWFPWLGFIKEFLSMFWRTHAFINLKLLCVRALLR